MVDDALSTNVRTLIIYLKYYNVVLQEKIYIYFSGPSLQVFLGFFFSSSLILIKLEKEKIMEQCPLYEIFRIDVLKDDTF